MPTVASERYYRRDFRIMSAPPSAAKAYAVRGKRADDPLSGADLAIDITTDVAVDASNNLAVIEAVTWVGRSALIATIPSTDTGT
jgi:hypothetical protein